jgi:hypothetical protein
MKSQKEISVWLKANCGQRCLAALTDHDAHAIHASVAITPLLRDVYAPPALFAAYGAIVMEMQTQTRWLAYHAIAMELDWGHRDMIWGMAGLVEDDKPKQKAAFEPGGSYQDLSKV